LIFIIRDEYTNEVQADYFTKCRITNILFCISGSNVYLCNNKLFFRKVSRSIVSAQAEEESPGSTVHPALRTAGGPGEQSTGYRQCYRKVNRPGVFILPGKGENVRQELTLLRSNAGE